MLLKYSDVQIHILITTWIADANFVLSKSNDLHSTMSATTTYGYLVVEDTDKGAAIIPKESLKTDEDVS
jgi:hypothetical protein